MMLFSKLTFFLNFLKQCFLLLAHSFLGLSELHLFYQLLDGLIEHVGQVAEEKDSYAYNQAPTKYPIE